MNKTFAVLICVYQGDEPGPFRRALASIFANTLQPAQVVLVVDGPVGPETSAVIDAFSAAYASLSVVRCVENIGFSAALNKGLGVIDADWVVRADSDDWNLPHRFEALTQMMAPNLAIIGSSIAETNDAGEIYAIRRVPLSHAAICTYIRRRNPFNHMSVAFRRDLALKCGGYPKLMVREDYGLWASMIGAGGMGENIDEVLVHASAGTSMYQRRRSLQSYRAEIMLQRHLLRCGLTSVPGAIYYGALRSIALTFPAAWVQTIYKVFLRDKQAAK
jgi:glycosyltransferase involved in cell wall biosynthesis